MDGGIAAWREGERKGGREGGISMYVCNCMHARMRSCHRVCAYIYIYIYIYYIYI